MGEWKTVKLGDVCEIVTGSTPGTQNPELWNGNIKWVTPAEISDTSYFINDTERHISPKAGLKAMPAGTVLLSSRAPIGKVAIAGTPMCCNQGFKNLICSDQLNNRYLYRYLKSQTAYLNSLGRGATFKEISKPIVENIRIPLPPLHVQLEIADILDQVSILLEKRKTQIDKLDLLVKSRFVEMFGDPVRNPMGWEVKRLDEICENLDSQRIPITSSDRVEGPYPYYGASGITDRVADFIFNEDLLLVSEDGANLLVRATPIAFSVSGQIWVNNHAHVLKFADKAMQTYVEHRINRIDISMYITGTAQPKLNQAQLNSFAIPLPPLPLQTRFADFVRATDKSKLTMQRDLNKLELLYKSLVQKMFL
ncbi:MAG: restriction endonuclease subunit S [Peptococcaceae bacterium]|nr:restriction endonuclease subunit S [Peptococcaceae bacterium]